MVFWELRAEAALLMAASVCWHTGQLTPAVNWYVALLKMQKEP